MVEYTINAVNTLLISIEQNTDGFVRELETLVDKIPCPYTKDYLRIIKERGEDITLLTQNRGESKLKEILDGVIRDLIMIGGPVHSLIGLRRNYEMRETVAPNGILKTLETYAKSLEDYEDAITHLLE